MKNNHQQPRAIKAWMRSTWSGVIDVRRAMCSREVRLRADKPPTPAWPEDSGTRLVHYRLGVADERLTALSKAVASAKIFLAPNYYFACTCLVLLELLKPDLMFNIF